MDLRPTAAQEQLRAECRSWLREHLPWEYGTGLPPRFASLDEEVAFGRAWQHQLAEGRWVGVTWPEVYGGRGAGALAHYVVQEELARARAPELVGRIGVNLVGPTLLTHGTDAQRARWLPDILRADILFCQLFSEPDAGSDLASLSTRAVRAERDGIGGWSLTGQKVWTSYAQFADWGLCLARTDPDVRKQAGITAFAVDMRAPGVEVRPLRQITGESDFNEVFLDDVFVPDDAVIGAVNDGWRVSSSTLTHERGTNPRQLVIHSQHLDELLRLAAERGGFDDHRTAQRLSEAFVEVKLFQLHNWRSLSRLEAGQPVGPEGSALKLYWSEMSQRLHRLALDVLGPAGALAGGAEGNPGDGEWQRSWLYYQAASIFAGTNEIQRTIVGERVLDLPREPAPSPSPSSAPSASAAPAGAGRAS
ncbi:MAG TPA: acyl-CoA dehydrogenase family protein [Acidimicrobiales bacterium]|nr:acyl-CoA dehydrogenase family protein [Acidimicrobiales bacterium]